MRMKWVAFDLAMKLSLVKSGSLPSSRSGATGIEYALIAAGVALVLVGAFAVIGPQIGTILAQIGDALTGASAGAGAGQ